MYSAIVRHPGTRCPLRALHQRIAARRGMQIAIIAVARKIAVIAWHLITKEQDYAFARPSLVAFKRRKLELTADAERRIARRGAGYDYNNKQLRRHEREIAEQAETRLRSAGGPVAAHVPDRQAPPARHPRRWPATRPP
ncbi:uncharacterized protein YaiI (UPF0178 family) [Streptomyces canus]|uniref:Uncharacterized protein YaiI (UPF0178 family) n=1 Tax=Streptomyces canus TaxID=58343 RepID=A0AAW8F629_9ACTN|nr:hypothetical protein [Streptomyces canus]MDQ0904705.1 uncharacterized protein YaiI (UPF0178 family) [Streptomyces canus]